MSSSPLNLSLTQRIADNSDVYRALAKSISHNLRVGIPGIIVSFDTVKQTAKIDIAIREKLSINGQSGDVQISTLLDVPISLPRGGNFLLSMPIVKGDECFVIFSDMCINSWFQNGGIQSQEILRRHDLSDAVFFPGCWSQPNKVDNWSTDSAQLRTEDGTVFVGIDDDGIVTSGTPVTSTYTNVTLALPIKINGVTYYIKLSTTP